MKRLLVKMLIISTLLAFSGCSSETERTPAEKYRAEMLANGYVKVMVTTDENVWDDVDFSGYITKEDIALYLKDELKGGKLMILSSSSTEGFVIVNVDDITSIESR